MTIRALGFGAALVGVAVGAASGQTPRRDSLVAAAVRQEWLVRLTADQGRLIGHLENLAGGAVDVVGSAGRRSIRIDGIDSLWGRGRALKTGAIVGGALGAVGGGLFGAFLAAICDAAECRSPGSGALIGGLVGIPTGMVVGTAAGALFPRWNRKIP